MSISHKIPRAQENSKGEARGRSGHENNNKRGKTDTRLIAKEEEGDNNKGERGRSRHNNNSKIQVRNLQENNVDSKE